MCSNILCACLLLAFGLGASGNLEKYQGYKKYSIFHDNEDAFNVMYKMQMIDPDLDFWLLTRNMSIISVGPATQTIFEQRLNELNIKFSAKSLMEEMNTYNESDLNENCFDGDVACAFGRVKRQARGFFNHFPRYAAILKYMSALANRFPQYCRYESMGRSHEGRHLATLTISLDARRKMKRIAYVQAGTHGREWIAPITALYFMNELLNNILAFRSILIDTEIVILPLVNPDGYEYTHISDRFWRKNRHRYPDRTCVGVDINRNFPNNWNYRGASQNLCSEVFSGASPASEAETAAITRYLQSNRHRVKLSVDIHSFGNFIFYPFGYERNTPAPTRHFLHEVANRAASQIAKYRGTHYTVGTSANILYEASGGLDDFAYGNLGIPMSFTVELPGENFHVDSRDIIHVCKETFAGLIELIRHVGLFL